MLERGLLEGLIEHPGASVVALDARADLDEEAMKAQVVGDRVVAMGKWLSVADAGGESIGVERIAASHAPRLFQTIDRMMASGKEDAYYEDAYHLMVQDGWELHAWPIGELRWSEIDDAADLERARALMSKMD